MEMARCLLFKKKLLKKLWAEAINIAVYLLNRLPMKTLENRTTFEMWYGYKPSIQNLKVFGCICYTHVLNVKRDKLDQKVKVGIFIGYNNITKGYRVHQTLTNKVIVSRDIKFDEYATWNWDVSKMGINENIQAIPKAIQDEVVDESVDDTPVKGTRSLTKIY